MINELVDVKNDIKNAIIAKGGDITGGLITYADAIRGINGSQFDLLGYDIEDVENVMNALRLKLLQEIDTERSTYEEILNQQDKSDDFHPYNRSDVMFPVFFDTSKYTDWSDTTNPHLYGFFTYSPYIVCMPKYDTSKVNNMNLAFCNCYSLVIIPELDFNSCTTARGTFDGCEGLQKILIKNTGRVQTFSFFCYNCISLKVAPELDTSSATIVDYMFFDCTALEEVPLMDFSNVVDMSSMFYDCNNITTLGGFKNLGKPTGYKRTVYFLEQCPNLTRESLLNVFNNLYDRTSAGYATEFLSIGDINLSKLTDEDIAIATNKGWKLY